MHNAGGHVLTATPVFGGIDRAMHQSEIPGGGQTHVTDDIAAQLARNIAKKSGPYNIRANALAPGLIKTDFSGPL